MAPSDPSGAPPPPTWTAGPGRSHPTGYGGFWVRLLAYLIDGILLNIAFGIIGAIVGISLIPVDPTQTKSMEILSDMGRIQLVALLITWLYFALMESSPRGATVGKMALGLRVVDEQGNRISFARATGRFFAKFVSTLILFIGYLMVAFTERKRGLHDIIAGTLVVEVR